MRAAYWKWWDEQRLPIGKLRPEHVRAAWDAALAAAKKACEAVEAQDRNVGEDCLSGYGGYKLGARACVSSIAALGGK